MTDFDRQNIFLVFSRLQSYLFLHRTRTQYTAPVNNFLTRNIILKTIFEITKDQERLDGLLNMCIE